MYLYIYISRCVHICTQDRVNACAYGEHASACTHMHMNINVCLYVYCMGGAYTYVNVP